jgi:pyrimidine-nucleoside phosphorylase
LGAGRLTKDDAIDFNAGIVLNKKIGDQVKKGDILATLYTNQQANQIHMNGVLSAFTIVDHPIDIKPIIYDWIE